MGGGVPAAAVQGRTRPPPRPGEAERPEVRGRVLGGPGAWQQLPALRRLPLELAAGRRLPGLRARRGGAREGGTGGGLAGARATAVPCGAAGGLSGGALSPRALKGSAEEGTGPPGGARWLRRPPAPQCWGRG